MTTHVLRGSKQEIADTLAGLDGEVREAIVFIGDSLASIAPGAAASQGTSLMRCVRSWWMGTA